MQRPNNQHYYIAIESADRAKLQTEERFCFVSSQKLVPLFSEEVIIDTVEAKELETATKLIEDLLFLIHGDKTRKDSIGRAVRFLGLDTAFEQWEKENHQ